MKNEKRFKELLGQKFNTEEDFDFDENNWKEAKKMILASRKNNRRKPLAYLFLGLAFLSVGLLCFYFFDVILERNTVAGQNIINTKPAILENNSSENSSVTEDKEAENKPRHSAGNKGSAHSVTQSETTAAVYHKEKNTTLLTHKKRNNNLASTKQAQLTPLQQAEQSTNTDKNMPVTETVVVTNTCEFLPLKRMLLETDVTHPEIENTIAWNVMADSAGIEPPVNVNKVSQPRRLLSVEAGMDYMAGWKYGTVKDGKGFNPVVGVSRYIPAGIKTGFSIGLFCNTVMHLSYSTHVSKNSSYSLGEDGSFNIFTPKALYYAGVPVTWHYQHNRNHKFGAGAYVAYLITASGRQESYMQNLMEKYDQQFSKTWGYTEGFNPFDLRATVHYSHRLKGALWMKAELMYGLRDVKSNAFFDTKRTERNSGLRISLVYNFYNKHY